MKALKTILSNDDILARYKLLCLWSVEQFLNSLDEDASGWKLLNNLLNQTLLNQNQNLDTSSPETIYSTLMDIRQNLTNQLTRLTSTLKHIEQLAVYVKLIGKITDEQDANIQQIDKLKEQIDKLQTYISRIDNISIQDIREQLEK